MKLNTQRLVILLRQLFELSQRQVEALDRKGFGDIERILTEKDDLLKELAKELEKLSSKGIAVMNPKTYPVDQENCTALAFVATQIRRYNAHEKAVAVQVKLQHEDISNRLQKLHRRKQSLTSYSKHPVKRQTLCALG